SIEYQYTDEDNKWHTWHDAGVHLNNSEIEKLREALDEWEESHG
ncbi:hypothetical protein LCGC14_2994160, partial [marine sediment metagenome]